MIRPASEIAEDLVTEWFGQIQLSDKSGRDLFIQMIANAIEQERQAQAAKEWPSFTDDYMDAIIYSLIQDGNYVKPTETITLDFYQAVDLSRRTFRKTQELIRKRVLGESGR